MRISSSPPNPNESFCPIPIMVCQQGVKANEVPRREMRFHLRDCGCGIAQDCRLQCRAGCGVQIAMWAAYPAPRSDAVLLPPTPQGRRVDPEDLSRLVQRLGRRENAADVLFLQRVERDSVA